MLPSIFLRGWPQVVPHLWVRTHVTNDGPQLMAQVHALSDETRQLVPNYVQLLPLEQAQSSLHSGQVQ